jgi:hypothetical protein
MNVKVLTLTSYGEKPGESYRFTPQPMNIAYVETPEAMVERQGMTLYKVYVKFVAEGSATLYLSREDLRRLEEAVGMEGFDDFETL